MDYKVRIIFWLLLLFSINQVKSQNDTNANLIESDSLVVVEEHKLDLPLGAISLNFSSVFEVDGKLMLFAYCYPLQYIYIYDLTNDSIIEKIYPHNMGVEKIEYFNKDSILIYGYPLFNFNSDSIIRCINFNGDIKHIYPVIHSNIASSKNIPEHLFDDKIEMYPKPQFIYDRKIFMTFDYPYYGLKGYKKKYPIIGYYDLEKDSLITIDHIWYPFLKEGMYYKKRFYKPNIALKENGNILISFSYTPTFYEWNVRTNKLITHFVNSKFMPAVPFSSTLFISNEEYNDNSYKEGIICGVNSFKIKTDIIHPDYIYSRSFLLPSLNIRGNKSICVYYDENYRFCGESMGGMPNKSYKGNYVSSYISKGKILVRFYKPAFKPYNEIALIAKLDSIKKNEMEKEKSKNKELCAISGKSQPLFTYQKDDIIVFLKNTQQILDTSFAIAIINKSGCGPCNDYVLQFLEYNQLVFFNMKPRPFYLLYVSENVTIEDVETYLDGYRLFEKNHVKKDISPLYQNFNPSGETNPRLIFVSQSKVVFDKVYMPNDLEQFTSKLSDYYGLEKE
jgi:hypothetical protein